MFDELKVVYGVLIFCVNNDGNGYTRLLYG